MSTVFGFIWIGFSPARTDKVLLIGCDTPGCSDDRPGEHLDAALTDRSQLLLAVGQDPEFRSVKTSVLCGQTPCPHRGIPLLGLEYVGVPLDELQRITGVSRELASGCEGAHRLHSTRRGSRWVPNVWEMDERSVMQAHLGLLRARLIGSDRNPS